MGVGLKTWTDTQNARAIDEHLEKYIGCAFVLACALIPARALELLPPTEHPDVVPGQTKGTP
jgi:hypothetical protein